MTTPADGEHDNADQPPSPPEESGAADTGPTRLDAGRIPGGRRAANARPGVGADATWLDPGRTPRRPAGDDEAEWGDGRLPAALARRFTLIEELTTSAAQAIVLLVSDRATDHKRVIKLYHQGVVPSRQVWTWLERQANSPAGPAGNHIVRVFETGFAARRAYEVMEYVAGGDLYKLPRTAQLAPDADLMREVVGQVATALATAHAVRIGHRDVKPANVLIRSLEPLDVVLTDFGISTPVALAGQAHPTRSMTPQYAAPEWLLAGSLSHSVDWWALGITIAELAGGQHPFDGVRPEAIMKSLASARPVNLALVKDPRLKLLCRGLLIADEADRWSYRQVEQWYRGESPEVPDHGGIAAGEDETRDDQHAKAFGYFGEFYLTPTGLSLALAREWEVAASYFFGTEVAAGFFGTERVQRSHRQDLRQWLASLDDSLRPAGGPEQFDQIAKGRDRADVKLLRLVRWLNPGFGPAYRDVDVSMARLPVLAQQGITGQSDSALGAGLEAVRYVIRDLWDFGLLTDLANAPGGSGLAETDERWRQHEARWRYLTAELRRRDRHVGQLLANVAEDTVLCYLLWLASAEEAARTYLRATATTTRASLTDDVPWFSWLSRAEADVLSLLAAVLLAGSAESESQQIGQDREAARTARRRSLRYRAVERWYRKHDRPTALGWAGAGITVVAVAWSWSIGLSDVLPFASANAVELAWVCAVLSLIVFAAAELWLAAAIGGPYHPGYSLIGAALSRGGRAVRPLVRSGPLALTVLASGAVALLAATIFIPFLLPVLTTAGEIAWIRGRHQQWLTDEQERAAQRRLAVRERRAEHGSV